MNTPKRKLCFVIGTLDTGGSEGQVVGLANTFSQNNYDVTILVLRLKNGEIKHVINKSVNVVNIDFNKSFYGIIGGITKFAYLLKKNKFNYLYAMLPESVLLSYPLHRIFNPKLFFISGIRGSLIRRNRVLQEIYKFILRKSDLIISNSDDALKKTLKEAYVNVNSVVIKNGINFPIASADTSINPPTGIVIANFHTYKNYENLIRAIAAANVNSKFIFIGAGVQLAECKALASELRIKNKILFTGECNPHRFLRKAQYGIHVSLSEGMSNAIMEELAYGLPVLASNITANKALISDGVNGLLVNPEDIISIADGLKRICIDSNLRIELSKNTFKSIEAYSWQSVYREYEDTLSKLQPKI